MSDLIKQQAVIDKLDEIQKDIIASSECYSCTVELVEAIDYIQQEIYELPTVEAKPVVHGEWIKGDRGEWQCSVCREENCYAYCEPLKRFTDLYCPNCGADMRGEKHD